MSAPGAKATALDGLLDDPARLAVVAALGVVDGCDVRYLRALTGLTADDLAAHLAALEAAGLVATEERSRGRDRGTWVVLRRMGQEVLDRSWGEVTPRRRWADRRRGRSSGR